MKAYDIMTFMIILNMCFAIVSALAIYDMGGRGESVPDKFDPTQYNATYTNINDRGALPYRILGETLIVLVAGLISGALIGSWVLKIPADSGAAYGGFITIFWFSCYEATHILWRINDSIGMMLVLSVFLLLMGVIFFSALLQLVRGGWKGMK